MRSGPSIAAMEVNPYESPAPQSPALPAGAARADVPGEYPVVSSRPCPFCGSVNTGRDALSHVRPSMIFLLFFSWWFMLLRAAFSKRTDHCRDCGEVNVYKTTGSKVALVAVIVLALILALSLMEA